MPLRAVTHTRPRPNPPENGRRHNGRHGSTSFLLAASGCSAPAFLHHPPCKVRYVLNSLTLPFFKLRREVQLYSRALWLIPAGKVPIVSPWETWGEKSGLLRRLAKRGRRGRRGELLALPPGALSPPPLTGSTGRAWQVPTGCSASRL